MLHDAWLIHSKAVTLLHPYARTDGLWCPDATERVVWLESSLNWGRSSVFFKLKRAPELDIHKYAISPPPLKISTGTNSEREGIWRKGQYRDMKYKLPIHTYAYIQVLLKHRMVSPYLRISPYMVNECAFFLQYIQSYAMQGIALKWPVAFVPCSLP